MKETALITGASSGIGEAFARIHASKGGDVIIVARSEGKLNELKKEIEVTHRVNVKVIVKDLSEKNAAKEVYDTLKEERINVKYLFNNAGFGDYGPFVETDWEKEETMINLNITALTQLTKLYAIEMSENGEGRILNVASTAAFQPGPLMAVYYATKAYVLSFSEAVAEEVKESGVTVTTLCPGITASGFQKGADMEDSKLVKGKMPSSREVAEFGYNEMMKGKRVVVHGAMNSVLAAFSKMLPTSITSKVAMKMQERVDK